MEGKLKRRWLRFSVRTLMVAVTLLCLWLGWQVSIVRERTKLIRWAGSHGLVDMDYRPNSANSVGAMSAQKPLVRFLPPVPPSVPLYRKLLGDEPVAGFLIYRVWRDEPEVLQIRESFPEAMVTFSDSLELLDTRP